MSMSWPPKDTDETLDYHVDWSRALGSATIASVAWYVDVSGTKTSISAGETVGGLEAVSTSNTSTVATIYLNQGTNNKNYKLWCAVTTDGSLVMERVVRIKIREYS